ncbi:MAG: hypothetical protein KQH53_14140 [Desulfarculaceae bacterium]|nr:hypothetical protein [Desulfarculaceae bacterium]
MKELPLHPLSMVLTFRFAEPRSSRELEALVAGLFDALSRAVVEGGTDCVIGHIKGLAKLGEADWLKVSVISPDRPAQALAEISRPLEAMDMAVNLMVYGREPEELWQIVSQVAERPGEAWSGVVAPQRPVQTVSLHDHHHDHHSH